MILTDRQSFATDWTIRAWHLPDVDWEIIRWWLSKGDSITISNPSRHPWNYDPPQWSELAGTAMRDADEFVEQSIAKGAV